MSRFHPLKTFKKYIHTLITIHSSPRAIAAGTAVGVYVSFTPFMGAQTVISVALASIFGSNRLAAAIGVNLHTPILWTWPAVYAIEYKFGQWMLGSHSFPPFQMSHLSWTSTFHLVLPILLGSFVLGIPAGIAVFFITRSIVSKYQAKHSHYEQENIDEKNPGSDRDTELLQSDRKTTKSKEISNS